MNGDLYHTVLDVFKCEQKRLKSARMAFSVLSSEGKEILTKHGFQISEHMAKIVTTTKLQQTWYYKEVWRLTELIAHKIPGIEKRGFKDHHIDHIKSIHYGHKNNIPISIIADLTNLRMLPYKENMKKGIKVDM
jgi:hypothetical protein